MPASVTNIADAGCEHFAEGDFDGLRASLRALRHITASQR